MSAVEDIAKLKSILGSGVLKVRLADGKETTFADDASLLRRIKVLEADIAGAAAARPSQTTYAQFGGRR